MSESVLKRGMTLLTTALLVGGVIFATSHATQAQGPPPLPFSGSSLAANATTVFVLRGNALLSFDARTLRPLGRTEVPPASFAPGGAPGGFNGR